MGAGASYPASEAATNPATDCILPAGGSEGSIDYDKYVQPVGSVAAVMLFVDFPDAPAASSADAASDVLLPMAGDWLSMSSYGALSLEVTPVLHWLRMPEPVSAYAPAAGTGFSSDAMQRYASAVVALADDEVDFSEYAMVYIVPNAEATAIGRSVSQTSTPGRGILADGVAIRSIVAFGTWIYDKGYGVMTHETSHLFGLPDLYLYAGDPPTDRFVGSWDLMGQSQKADDHIAFSKWRMGWLADEQIDCVNTESVGDYTLTPLETTDGTKAIVLRTGLYTAIAAEYRTAQGLDEDICSTGVLVYTLDSKVKGGSGPVRIQDANPSTVVRSGACGRQLDDAAFPQGAIWSDPATGITIEVTADRGDEVDLHVTRPGTYDAPVRHERTLTMRTKTSDSGAVTVTGTLAVADGFAKCRSGRKVSLQEYRDGAWVTIRTAVTKASGAWTYKWTPDPGFYRLMAIDTWTSSWYCLPAYTDFVELP